MNRNNDEIEIDLLELIGVLIKKIWIIVLFTVLGLALAAGITTLFIKPKYKSTAILYVLTKTADITSLADIQIGTSLTQDYMVVITSRPVLQTVIDDLGLDTSVGQLREGITVNNPTNTRFLEITVENEDAYLSKKIVDDLADVSAERMASVLDTKEPNIMDYGQIPASPSSPNLIKNGIIGALIGFIIACGIIIVMYLLNDSIKTTEDIEKYLGINTLGVIPLADGVSKKKTHRREKTVFKKNNTSEKIDGKSDHNSKGKKAG